MNPRRRRHQRMRRRMRRERLTERQFDWSPYTSAVRAHYDAVLKRRAARIAAGDPPKVVRTVRVDDLPSGIIEKHKRAMALRVNGPPPAMTLDEIQARRAARKDRT